MEPFVVDGSPRNIETLMEGVDIVLDGTDNIETRYLLNDACEKLKIPWIYGGAVGSEGMTMNILPGRSACFRCLMAEPPQPGSLATCDTAGVLGPVPGLIASIQAAQALKYLAGHDLQGNLLTYVDLWEGRFVHLISPFWVIPAEAGILSLQYVMDSRLRGSDGLGDFLRDHQI